MSLPPVRGHRPLLQWAQHRITPPFQQFTRVERDQARDERDLTASITHIAQVAYIRYSRIENT